MRSFRDLQRNEVVLGRFLGRGGEGAVYSVPARPRLVAKIYVKTPDSEMESKLAAMVELATEALATLAAWPQDLLRDERTASVVGFLMPRVEDHRGIHALYGPTSRKTAFPDATWAFLVRAARNVAATFDTVHQHGHVIGDVNEGNVVVSQAATVRLIDCDSFQITHAGGTHPCRVGVPLYTPPELQGQKLENAVRRPDHDRFGLAVLVFQLLFMGRHPFAGLHPEGAIPVEMAIREGLFAFGREAARQGWEPPPFSLRITDIPLPLAQLFERAFGMSAAGGAPRPTAAEWVRALGDVEAAALTCGGNPRHIHVAAYDSCPWCRIEREGGPLFFPAPKAAPEVGSRRQEIVEAFERLRTGTLYELLGVPHTASEQEIKEAYFRQAKRFHPDVRHDPAFADLADRVEAVFMRLGEAYEVLKTPPRRATYNARLRLRTATAGDSSAQLPLDPAAERQAAENAIRRASQLFEKGSYWDTIQLLEPTIPRVKGAVKHQARILLARAYAQNPKWVRRAEEHLREVLGDDPHNVSALLALARIYKGINLGARARALFWNVLQLDPRNQEARAELGRDREDDSSMPGTAPDETLPDKSAEPRSGDKTQDTPGEERADRSQLELLGVLALEVKAALSVVEARLTTEEREWILDAIDRVKALATGEIDEIKRGKESLKRALRLLEAVRFRH